MADNEKLKLSFFDWIGISIFKKERKVRNLIFVGKSSQDASGCPRLPLNESFRDYLFAKIKVSQDQDANAVPLCGQSLQIRSHFATAGFSRKMKDAAFDIVSWMANSSFSFVSYPYYFLYGTSPDCQVVESRRGGQSDDLHRSGDEQELWPRLDLYLWLCAHSGKQALKPSVTILRNIPSSMFQVATQAKKYLALSVTFRSDPDPSSDQLQLVFTLFKH